MALSSQADVGSVEVLKCPAGPPPAVAQPRPSSVQCHYQALARSQRQDLPAPRGSYSILTPWKVRAGGGGEGQEELPPLPWGAACLLRLVVGQRQPHIPLFCQGASLQGLPQGPGEGVRSASQKLVRGILQAGASLETEPPANVLSQLNSGWCCRRGSQDAGTQWGRPSLLQDPQSVVSQESLG